MTYAAHFWAVRGAMTRLPKRRMTRAVTHSALPPTLQRQGPLQNRRPERFVRVLRPKIQTLERFWSEWSARPERAGPPNRTDAGQGWRSGRGSSNQTLL